MSKQHNSSKQEAAKAADVRNDENELSDDEPLGRSMMSAAVAVAPPSVLSAATEFMHAKEDEASEYRSALPPMSHTAYMVPSDEEAHFRDLPMNATLPAGIAPFNTAEDDDDSDVKWRSLSVAMSNVVKNFGQTEDIYAEDGRGAIFDTAHLKAHLGMQSASASTTLTIRELPPYPFFLERDHFYSMLKDEELMERVRDTLVAFDVDSTFTFDPCCWTAVVYNGAKFANFKVKIFRIDGDLKVVEFQRRSGDCFAFKSMFRDLLNYLCNQKVVCTKDRQEQAAKPVSATRMRAFAPLPFKLDDEEEEEFTVQVATESIRPLERMMTSEYCDIQLEGAQAMAGLLRGDNTKETCTYAQVDGLMDSISKVARESGGHISRCAAMCIRACTEAAVKEQQQSLVIQQKIVDTAALEALVTLAQGGESVLIETQRQAVRGLVAVSHTHSANIMALGSQEMLDNLSSAAEDDERLSDLLEKLKEAFASAAASSGSE